MIDKSELKILRDLELLLNELLSSLVSRDSLVKLSSEDQQKLSSLLASTESSTNPFVQKLFQLERLIKSELTSRQIMDILIPVERALQRDLKDSDFLVSETDKSTSGQTHVDRRPLVFVLENLRSSFNVGSIFRLADGLAVSKICLCGYTPLPEQNTESKNGLTKAALGAEKTVPYEHFNTTQEAIKNLKLEGYKIVGLETSSKATSLFTVEFLDKTALVVGNERFGIDYQTLSLCDELVKLPLAGVKNSLNVGTALTGAAFEWTRQYASHRTLPQR